MTRQGAAQPTDTPRLPEPVFIGCDFSDGIDYTMYAVRIGPVLVCDTNILRAQRDAMRALRAALAPGAP